MFHDLENENFPYILDETKWGRVAHVEEECPGVFYLATEADEKFFCREIYAVTSTATPAIISEEALQYGKRDGQLILFEHELEGAGWDIIHYEICRYRIKNKLPLGGDSLYCLAIYASEKYPEYFGGLLPPRYTPFGLTVRTKKAAEGVYFLETDRCQWVLAVAYIIWNNDLSEYAKKQGTIYEGDKQIGVDECQYMFFDEGTYAVPIYELLKMQDYDGLKSYIRSNKILESYLYFRHPEYTVGNNILKMSGHGSTDILLNILTSLGCEAPDELETEEEAAQRLANCICFTPGAEKERLLNLPI